MFDWEAFTPRLPLDPDKRGLRGDAIRHHFEFAQPPLLCRGNIERSRDDLLGCDAHAAVVMGAAIEDMSRGQIGDPDERIVGRRLHIISVSGSLRHAIEAYP